MSGHPGGSISSGRFVASTLFDAMDYDLSDPDREDADVISYAAGHKAMGLYAMWALRNEIARVGAPALLPADEKFQLRLEDLLGFRRNPINSTPLFSQFRSKALDGHPTPATPFLKLSTGASGVGVASSLGLALGAADYFGEKAPKVHIVEGEGGLTPGRVYESLAFAGTASLGNAVIHLDWNQASIDSNRVTREGDLAGDYVQWTPMELFYLHDWNVVYVPDGTDFQTVVAAQRRAATIDNGQPTAIVYRTTKGWRYGIEGRASHGAGHKFCSPGYAEALRPLVEQEKIAVPLCESGAGRCADGNDKAIVESCFWQALGIVRASVERNPEAAKRMAKRLLDSRNRLVKLNRKAHGAAPRVDDFYAAATPGEMPAELLLQPGSTTTLRGELGKVLGYLNRQSDGSILVSAADLLGSTSVNEITKGFADGWFNWRTNNASRTLSIGGICEDAIAGVLSGVAAYGRHVGVGSSYGAFIAPLGHIAARLHAIGGQARKSLTGDAYKPFFLVCAHAGLKTGEDGPTHADPQPLQLMQENFPVGTAITLTPWDPQEMWPLVTTAISKRPAVIVPFVTRPNEKVIDREALGLAPASAATSGLYLLRAADGDGDGTIVLQESGVAYAFVEQTLERIRDAGYDLNVYYVASAELFDQLPEPVRRRIFPEQRAQEAMGITGFTLPTMYRWIRSDLGRSMTMHPYQTGHYPGSGQGEVVIAEARLDGDHQFAMIKRYVDALWKARKGGLVESH
jgi:transketolase